MATRDELPDLVARMVASGLYPDSPTTRAVAEGWLRSPRTWCFVVTWHGAPLQYDTYHFPLPAAGGDESADLPDRPLQIQGGFNSHHDRERPHWFYREVGRPMLEGLIRMGARQMVSPIRADRPQWLRYLQDTYGAVPVGATADGRAVLISYDLARAVAACSGWPGVRTLGPEWRFTEGAASVREATAADLVELAGTWMAATWAGSPRRATIERMLDRWVGLDQATVLLGSVAGVLKEVRAFRHRREGITSIGFLSPVQDPYDARQALIRGFCAWCRGVGYRYQSMWVPPWQFSDPAIAARLSAAGWTYVATVDGAEGKVYELRLDVAEAGR